jgi:hypothetical protein
LISSSDSLCLAFCESHNIPFTPSKINPNPHSISHVCRDEVIRLLLVAEGKKKQNLCVLDWFGGNRNRKFDPSKCGPFGVNRSGKSSAHYLRIVWISAPSDRIAGDTHRAGNRVSLKDGNKFDFVISQDVYHDGPYADSPFTPATIRNLSQYSNKIYISGRLFKGWAGADLLGVEKFEQVYLRDEQGLIVSSPDPVSPSYPRHPDINWVFENRSYHGIDIVPMSNVGPFYTSLCSVAPKGCQQLGYQYVDEGPVRKVRIAEPSGFWANSLFKFWFSSKQDLLKHEVLVHSKTYSELGLQFSVKAPNGQILDSLISRVSSNFNMDPTMKAILQRFPAKYAEIKDGTVLACLYGQREATVSSFHNMRKNLSTTEIDLQEMRASTFNEREEETSVCEHWISGLMMFLSTIGVVIASINWLPNRVLPHMPFTSLLLEEVIGWCSPEIYVFLVMFEVVRTFKTYGFLDAMVIADQHFIYMFLRWYFYWGSLYSLIFHWLYNLAIDKTWEKRSNFRFDSFKRNYEEGVVTRTWTNNACVVPADTVFSSYVSKVNHVPHKLRGNIDIYVDHNHVSSEIALDLLSDGVGLNKTYPVLITNRLLHQPANCEKNLLVAILFRIHADPFEANKYSEQVRHGNWRRLAGIFVKNNLVDKFPVRQYTIVQNTELMGRKGKRILNAYNALVRGEIISENKTINLKWNETLSIAKDLGGVLTMKPRSIQNLQPHVHALMGPFSRKLADSIHQSFHPERIHTVCGKTVRIVFASGYDGDKLTRLAEVLLDGVFTVIVSGDDSVVSFGNESRDGFSFGEADQSQFDHTQDDGPCKIFQSILQEYMGFPAEFTKLAYESCSSGYTARRGRLFIKGHGGTQMPTGITVTTTYNSLSTAAFWIWWLVNPGMTVQEAGASLGFKVKYFPRNCLSQATFLKGWWLPTIDDHFVWRPLPSALLKLGKMIRDPVEVTSFIRHGKRMKRDRVEAIKMCAYALASSYSTVGSDYPIFGDFLCTLRRVGVQPPSTVAGLIEGEKPKPSLGTLDRDAVLNHIQERYGITSKEVNAVAGMFKLVSSLPFYLEHPLFDKLADVDYA